MNPYEWFCGPGLHMLMYMCLSQKFFKEVEKLLGSGGSKLYEKRKDKAYLQQVDQVIGTMRGFQKEPGNLKEYSPWLSSFKADTIKNELEVPGWGILFLPSFVMVKMSTCICRYLKKFCILKCGIFLFL